MIMMGTKAVSKNRGGKWFRERELNVKYAIVAESVCMTSYKRQQIK